MGGGALDRRHARPGRPRGIPAGVAWHSGVLRPRPPKAGRWLLVPAPLVGCGVGSLVPAGDALVAMLLAFLTGGIVLNVLKEELPEERESRFLPFAFGALTYSALVLLV